MNRQKHSLLVAMLLCCSLLLAPGSLASSQPVRLAITASSGNGVEQQIADYISAHFSEDPNVVISTVNPDWYVQCKSSDAEDRFTGQVHCNGTVTIKTQDGQTIATFSSQSYKQDFSTQLGQPNNRQGAPINKALVQSVTNSVVSDLGQKATDKIKEAVQVEVQARENIAEAKTLAGADKYDDAINTLGKVTQDSVHYQAMQKRMDEYKMEKQAFDSITKAQANAKKGSYDKAIASLKDIDPKSKRHKQAMELSSHYKKQLALAHAQLKHLAADKMNRVWRIQRLLICQAVSRSGENK